MKIGSNVTDLEFQAFHNEEIKNLSLAEFKGKWLILLFYPADFTFVCPTELGDAAKFYPEFKKINAEIISVSTDTVFTHKAWHDQSSVIKTIEYPMGADPSGKICKEFGTYIDEEGLSLRASFIIDPDGVLKCMEIHDNSIGRNIEEILRKTQAAIYVREHKNEVCPANWKPGNKTLIPGLDLVGKI